MHVLLFRVEDEKSAVVVDRGEVYADAPELVKYDRLPRSPVTIRS